MADRCEFCQQEMVENGICKNCEKKQVSKKSTKKEMLESRKMNLIKMFLFFIRSLGQKGKHIGIFGDSKSGKTVYISVLLCGKNHGGDSFGDWVPNTVDRNTSEYISGIYNRLSGMGLYPESTPITVHQDIEFKLSGKGKFKKCDHTIKTVDLPGEVLEYFTKPYDKLGKEERKKLDKILKQMASSRALIFMVNSLSPEQDENAGKAESQYLQRINSKYRDIINYLLETRYFKDWGNINIPTAFLFTRSDLIVNLKNAIRTMNEDDVRNYAKDIYFRQIWDIIETKLKNPIFIAVCAAQQDPSTFNKKPGKQRAYTPLRSFNVRNSMRRVVEKMHEMEKMRKRKLTIFLGLILIFLGFTVFVKYNLSPHEKNMVFIQADKFTMGSNEEERLNILEHTKRIVKPFFIDKYEVTNEQYSVFLKNMSRHPHPTKWCHPDEAKYGKKSHIPEYWESSEYKMFSPTLDSPVTYVDWFDAYAFAKWTGKRLPTEAEWEIACRGKKGQRFPWGDTFGDRDVNTGKRYSKTLHGGFCIDDKSPYGIFDMAGNVREFTADTIPSPNQDTTNIKDFREQVIIRGGDFEFSSEKCTCFRRESVPLTHRMEILGFRCVKDAK